MALFRSKQIVAGAPAPTPQNAVDTIAVVGDFTVPAGLALNDVIEMVGLDADLIPVDAILSAEDADSNGTPLISLDVGVLSGAYGSTDQARTCGTEFIAASIVARAGGVARMDRAAGALLAPSQSARGIGLKVAAAAATLTVGAKFRLTLLCRSCPLTVATA